MGLSLSKVVWIGSTGKCSSIALFHPALWIHVCGHIITIYKQQISILLHWIARGARSMMVNLVLVGFGLWLMFKFKWVSQSSRVLPLLALSVASVFPTITFSPGLLFHCMIMNIFTCLSVCWISMLQHLKIISRSVGAQISSFVPYFLWTSHSSSSLTRIPFTTSWLCAWCFSGCDRIASPIKRFLRRSHLFRLTCTLSVSRGNLLYNPDEAVDSFVAHCGPVVRASHPQYPCC